MLEKGGLPNQNLNIWGNIPRKSKLWAVVLLPPPTYGATLQFKAKTLSWAWGITASEAVFLL
jgi:hypothetical protein